MSNKKNKNKVGRPVTIWTEENQIKLSDKLLAYIDDNEIPILAEFAYQNDITREFLYQLKELTYAIKKCHDKKESALERNAINGKINVTMAIFSLKQLGWKDKQEFEHTGKDGGEILIKEIIVNRDEAANTN